MKKITFISLVAIFTGDVYTESLLTKLQQNPSWGITADILMYNFKINPSFVGIASVASEALQKMVERQEFTIQAYKIDIDESHPSFTLLDQSFDTAIGESEKDEILIGKFIWNLYHSPLIKNGKEIFIVWFEQFLMNIKGIQRIVKLNDVSTYDLLETSVDLYDFLTMYKNSFHGCIVSLYDCLSNYGIDQLNDNNNHIENQIKTVIVVAPVYVTGGVENLCQIAHELNRQGFQVFCLWMGGIDCINEKTLIKKYKNGQWHVCGHQENFAPLVYKNKYDLHQLDVDITLDESTLVILPEIYIDYARFFGKAQKMIYWLSAMNMHVAERSRVVASYIEKKILGAFRAIHASQAPWITKCLLEWGAHAYPLGDYIGLPYYITPKTSLFKKYVAYAPRRGEDLARKFVCLYPNYDYFRLENLDELGMIQALDKCKIFIDFGHFPGKDRTHREALLRDCIVLVHNKGCATDYDSFPLDDYFKFSQQDVIDGVLALKVQNILNNYEEMYQRQSLIREMVRSEPEEFRQNIKNIFGLPKQNENLNT